MPKTKRVLDQQAGAPLSRKEKRQLKKQKRGSKGRGDEDSDGDVPPMPEMPDKGVWDFSPACVKPSSKGNKASIASGGGVIKTCPKGHPLVVAGTPHDEYMCDAAETCQGAYLPTGSMLYGCRLCDWDACEKCMDPRVKDKLLEKLKEQESKAALKAKSRSEEVPPAERIGEWKHFRGTDQYLNEYLVLGHALTGSLVEMHHYSDGQFTFQNGSDCMVRCVSSPGALIPFQFTQKDLIAKLVKGGGKSLPKDKAIEFGNYLVTGLEDGGAFASMNFKFTKTTKNKDGENFKKIFTGAGLEMHMTNRGDVVYLPEESYGDKGLILEVWKDPCVTDRKDASNFLVDEEDRID